MGATGASRAGSLIDTTPFATSYVLPFGEPDSTSYGQTFRVPDVADSRLDSFTFFLHLLGGTNRYRAYVYEWDEARGQLQGNALYASPAGSVARSPGYAAVTLRTGGVELVPGRDYVAFLSTAGLFDQRDDASQWRITHGNPYQGGHFVFHNSRGEFPAPGVQWECGSGCAWWEQGADLAFRMTFNMPPIPEPSTAAMMLAGLCAVGGTALARRQRRMWRD